MAKQCLQLIQICGVKIPGATIDKTVTGGRPEGNSDETADPKVLVLESNPQADVSNLLGLRSLDLLILVSSAFLRLGKATSSITLEVVLISNIHYNT